MIESAQEFVRLRTSEDASEQSRATHDCAPEQVWFDVLRQYPDMAVWVVRNKTVPLSVLRVVARHADRQVRWAVASKRKLDAGLFAELATDEDDVVRKRIALNRKVPRSLLEQLAEDPSPLVRDAARERLCEGRG